MSGGCYEGVGGGIARLVNRLNVRILFQLFFHQRSEVESF